MPQFIMIQTYLDLGLGTDTWSDEDFIGRVSRVNRRVNTIESPIQTIKKCLIHYKMEWEKACATWAPGSSKMLPSLWRANRASRACWWQAKEGILGNSMGPQRVTYQDVRYSTNRALFVNSNTFYHVHFFWSLEDQGIIIVIIIVIIIYIYIYVCVCVSIFKGCPCCPSPNLHCTFDQATDPTRWLETIGKP